MTAGDIDKLPPEQKAAWIGLKRMSRERFREVFTTRYGPEVLAAILNELGLFSIDQSAIDPSRIAFGNWLLEEIGVNHAANIFVQIEARLAAANDQDLKTIEGGRP